jgi:Dyp-type peroxidase family
MAFDRSKGEPQLAVDEIQGDILIGLQKDFEWFIGFEITHVAGFKAFLKALTPRITTLRTVLEREFTIALQKCKKEHKREVFTFVGTNIGFTAAGLRELGAPGVDQITDASFRAGLAVQSPGLNDPVTGEGAPANWVVGKTGSNLHGILLVTGPTKKSVDDRLAQIRAMAGTNWNVLFSELGMTRQLDRGHEHFGYLDGVSQPGVRGQIDAAFPAHTFLTPSKNPNDPGQGNPGQDLLWPGEFVFGYPEQKPDDLDPPGPVKHGGAQWMDNGSFMVFRRLKQLVPEFNQFVDAQGTALNMDPDLLGARMVGRWKSGAPMVTTPLQDDPVLAQDPLLINDFEFSQDAAARRCPYAAHIRKSYPRDDITPAGSSLPTDFEKREASEANTQTHRIMRAGIPFGDEVSDDEAKQNKTLQDRGLMFVCYQTSIEDQFEFILKFWVNNPTFPPASGGNAGHDPILGQANGANRTRVFGGAHVNYPTGPVGAAIQLPSDFIVPTGGGYFFVPSISALATVLSA